ncbi:MAG: alpha/beta hydrolase [Bacteroidota bacterium]|nr:alpha/beta hydrolase [Bacteroidota bacterium]
MNHKTGGRFVRLPVFPFSPASRTEFEIESGIREISCTAATGLTFTSEAEREMTDSMQPRIMEKKMHVTVRDAGLYVTLYAHINEHPGEQRATLVFLHEALGSVGQWKSFPYELCRASACDGIVYDRKGHGKSSPMTAPRGLDFYREEATEYLPGLLAALNVRRPLLVGHSDGATIALTHAALFPGQCVGVISEAAHVIIEDVTVQGIREAKQLFMNTDLREKLMRYHGEKTDAVFAAWADTWLDPGLKDWDMLEVLERVTCPVLVVQGENDQYGSRRQVDLIDQHVAGSSELLWLEDCGHVPHLQARARVLAAMTDFIRRTSAPA